MLDASKQAEAGSESQRRVSLWERRRDGEDHEDERPARELGPWGSLEPCLAVRLSRRDSSTEHRSTGALKPGAALAHHNHAAA